MVLPAYNEAPNIGRALEEATRHAGRLFDDYEVMVVDDGSTDATVEIVNAFAREEPRVRVIRHGGNRGYGEALKTGFLESGMEFVFFTDADLQFDLAEMERLLPFAGTVDVVAGYRLKRHDPLGRRLNARAWNLLVRVLFYVPVRDIDCAFKLFDRRRLSDVDIESVGAMVNTELMVKLGRRGASVVEVGVHHRPRSAGESHGASPKVILTAFRELVRMHNRLNALDSRDL